MKAFTLISTLLAVASAAPSSQEAIGEFFDTTDRFDVAERTVLETSQKGRSTENGVKILARMSETRFVI
jgi:hypothetical protein